jgi:cobalt/nickel transport system permease protein
MFLNGKRGQLIAVGIAAWCSTLIASVVCTGELTWSGIVTWNVGFPAMANVHILIGVGEALITTLVVAAIARTRPDLLEENGEESDSRGYTAPLVYGLLVAIGLIIFVSPFASPWPDGLEKVAATLGFDRKAVTNPVTPAPLADYKVPGIGSISMATVLAGIAGMAVVFFLSFLLARLLVPKSETE